MQKVQLPNIYQNSMSEAVAVHAVIKMYVLLIREHLVEHIKHYNFEFLQFHSFPKNLHVMKRFVSVLKVIRML